MSGNKLVETKVYEKLFENSKFYENHAIVFSCYGHPKSNKRENSNNHLRKGLGFHKEILAKK